MKRTVLRYAVCAAMLGVAACGPGNTGTGDARTDGAPGETGTGGETSVNNEGGTGNETGTGDETGTGNETGTGDETGTGNETGSDDGGVRDDGVPEVSIVDGMVVLPDGAVLDGVTVGDASVTVRLCDGGSLTVGTEGATITDGGVTLGDGAFLPFDPMCGSGGDGGGMGSETGSGGDDAGGTGSETGTGGDTGGTGGEGGTISMDAGDSGVLPCEMGTMRCGGSESMCVNLQTDTANCGMCGRACATGQSCVMGACGCASGQTSCGDRCIDVSSDATNCGMCGRACAAGQTCVMGACACPMGQTSCGMGAMAACVNTATDNNNCGACGTACPAGRTCSMGACVCPTGQTSCGMGASASCVNTQSDNSNCGACGNACTGGSTCVMGTCQCPMGQTRCGTGAAAMCTDTQTDTTNCGACGTACPSGQVCSMGMCTVNCSAPLMRCGMGASQTCANVQTDDQNCGACGTVCNTVPNSFGGICTTGSCRPICQSGYGNCNTSYADGCESNLTNDINNCAMCGNRCPSSATNATGVTCASSRCTPTCQAPTATEDFRDCNANVADGCEMNVLSNNNNCGSCGNACAGGQTCISGRCTATSCNELHTRAPSLPSGVYWLDPDGAGPIAAYQAYCDMTNDGGGWTLVLRVRGGDTGYTYSQPIWTDANLANATNFDLNANVSAKYNGYLNLAFTATRLVFRTLPTPADGATLPGSFPTTGVIMNLGASSMRTAVGTAGVAQSGTRAGSTIGITDAAQPAATQQTAWLNAFPNGRIQCNCRTQGFNITSHSIRIGALGNQEDQCNSCDSTIGVGTAGNAVRNTMVGQWQCGGNTPADDRDQSGYAYVFVR